MKIGLRILSAIAPAWVTKLVLKKLTQPRAKPLRSEEAVVLATADSFREPFNDVEIQLYRWGRGAKKILLIHGWEGRAGNFASIIKALKGAGFTILTFDGPSHGLSGSSESPLFDFPMIVGSIIRDFGVDHIISHSFGGVAGMSALSQMPQLCIEKYVLIASPDKFTDRMHDISQKVGISAKVERMALAKIEEKYDLDTQKSNVSDWVQIASIKTGLIIHDKGDRAEPFAKAKNIHAHWPQSQLLSVEGTGHFKILHDPKVIDRILEFIK